MSKQTYAIDTGDGVQLAAGISAYEIDRVAQERANRLGESVFVYAEGSDRPRARKVNPSEADVEVICECSDWAVAAPWEECCRATAPASKMIVVDWMPDHLRLTHKASGTSMREGMPGAMRVRVVPECAAHMLKIDGEWCVKVTA